MIKVYKGSNTPERHLKEISEALRNGEIIIVPTDTRYSLCCDALNKNSIEALARLKGVDPSKSTFSIFFSEISQVSEFVKLDDNAFKLLKINTPGPFTFILPPGSSLPKLYKHRKEIGVRIPDHSFLTELINYYGNPLTGFSLPVEGSTDDEAYAYNPELIEELWGKRVAYVIDGGMGSMEVSSIVDCLTYPFEIIREGAVALKQ